MKPGDCLLIESNYDEGGNVSSPAVTQDMFLTLASSFFSQSIYERVEFPQVNRDQDEQDGPQPNESWISDGDFLQVQNLGVRTR